MILYRVYEISYEMYGRGDDDSDAKYYIDKSLAENDLKKRCKEFPYKDESYFKIQEINTEDYCLKG